VKPPVNATPAKSQARVVWERMTTNGSPSWRDVHLSG